MAKQIQDMPLKTGVSGNEDILIQDNGVTKRIKASELMDESTTVDLSGYYTKTEVDDLLDDVPTQSGYSIVVLTEEEYNALGTVDDNTIYIVKGLE